MVSGSGVSFSAFVLQIYPPWQIAVGLGVLAIFAGLFWRDRLWTTFGEARRWRLLGLGLTVASAGILLGAFVYSTSDAMRAFANSEYPGHRRLFGGGYLPWRFVAAFYNYHTLYDWDHRVDTTGSAGFFPFFPAVFFAALVSRRLRAKLGPVVWTSLPVLVLMVCYCVTEIPHWLANATLLTFVVPDRTQITIGLLSILCCVRLLAVASEEPRDRQALATGLVVFALSAGLYFWLSFYMQENWIPYGDVKFPIAIFVVSALAAAGAALLSLGMTRTFGAALVLALVVAAGNYNPLSVGFADWRTTELSHAVRQIANKDREEHHPPSIWLTYGGPSYPNSGMIGQILGLRTLGGIYGYPQLAFWAPLDPNGQYESVYNRFAVNHLMPTPSDDEEVRFGLAAYQVMRLWVSPLNPILREMGAHYILTFGQVPEVSGPPYELLYQGSDASFAIWGLPGREAIRATSTTGVASASVRDK